MIQAKVVRIIRKLWGRSVFGQIDLLRKQVNHLTRRYESQLDESESMSIVLGKLIAQTPIGDMTDLDYSGMKQLWRSSEELQCYRFPLLAIRKRDDGSTEGVINDNDTYGIVYVMYKHGYRCSTLEQLLK